MAANEIARLYVTVDANTKPFDQGLMGVDKRARKATGSLKKMAAAMGAGFLGAKVLGEVKDFDKAMRNVNSIAQLSEGRFKKLSKSVLDLAGKTAQAPKTLAQGLYDLESSGFKANESLLILKSTAKAASAGLTDTATSTKAVAAVLNAYHLKASAAAQVSDDLFQTVNLGVLSFEDLAQNIGDVLPFATTLGVSLKDLGAATSTLTKQGVPASETMTRIKGAMVALIKPTDDMQKVLKALGVTSGEELIRKTGSLQGALQALNTKVGGSKQALAKLFPDVRGLGGAFGLTGKNAASANKDLEGFKNTAGATDKVLKQQKKSLDYQWRQFKSELAAVVDEYGTKLIPIFNEGLKIIKKMAPAIIALGGAWAVFKTAALTQLAIVKAAELGLFGAGMKKDLAAEAAVTGKTVGKTFASKAGLAAAAAIAGWEIGKWLRKKYPAVREAGDFLGNTLGKAFYSKAGQWASKVALGILSPLGFAVKATGVFKGGGKVGTVNDLGATVGGIGSRIGKGTYQQAAKRAARSAGIDVNTFLRQIQQESGFDPNARSKAGAIGIAQFMPGTAKGLGVNPRNPLASLNAAAKLMASYIKKYGSWRNALIAYNAGPGAVGGKLPAETQNYLKAILGGGSGLNLTPMKLGGGKKKGGGADVPGNLLWAQQMVGHFKESTGSNTGPELNKLQKEFGTYAAAWCAEFATKALVKAGLPKSIMTARVSDLNAWAKAGAKGLSFTTSPSPGDLVTFGNNHVATVEKVNRSKGTITAISGNSSSGQVSRSTYALSAGKYISVNAAGYTPFKENNRGTIKALTNKDMLAFVQGRIEHFDLMVQAGLLSAAKAAIKKAKVIGSRLPYVTGDTKLQLLAMLRELPVVKQLTAAQKTWAGGGGGRDQLATAYALLNPGWANPRNKGMPVDNSINNPWLQAFLNKQDLLVGAGQLSPEQANALKIGALKNAIPGLSGNDALAAQGMIRDLTGTPTSFRDVIEKTIGNFGLAARAGDITESEARSKSIQTILENLGNPDLNDQDRLELRAELGDLRKSIDELNDNTQAQIDILKEQNAELKKLYNVSQAEEKVLGRAITNTVSNALGARVSLARKTPLRGGSLGVAY